jgi:hypothetical protein
MRWTTIWAGNEDYTDLYNAVSMRWTVPTVSADGGLAGNVKIWPGMGEYDTSTDPLVQAGSSQDAAPGVTPAKPYLWWEIITRSASGVVCGHCPLVPVANQPPAVGDSVFVNINYGVEGGQNTAIFWIENKNAKVDQVSYFYVAEDIGTTQATRAEWIVEKGTNLARWSGAINMNSSVANDIDVGADICAGTQTHWSVHMANDTTNSTTDTNTQIAYPAAWTDPGSYCNFPVYRTSVQ